MPSDSSGFGLWFFSLLIAPFYLVVSTALSSNNSSFFFWHKSILAADSQ
jgi:hypothetical protein